MKMNGVPVERWPQHRGDLVRVDLTGTAAGDREVLARDVDGAAQHGTLAGHHAVRGVVRRVEAEVRRLVLARTSRSPRSAGVEQREHPLPGGQLALGVLLLQPRLTTALLDARPAARAARRCAPPSTGRGA